MLEPELIEEFGVYVSALRLQQVPPDWQEIAAECRSAFAETWIQVVDAAAVAGLPHVLFSAFNAVSAFRHSYNKLVQLEAALLLVISGTDRFQKALETAGAKVGKPGVAIVMSRDRFSCTSAVEMVSSRIANVTGISHPSPEEAKEVARLQGLDLRSLGPAGGSVGAILALVERGSLLYS
ncbi:MAG: hypothetical protein JTT11_01275 [Candidatus Brockarchaeota archaeon]|nr:hypothetical protein [Candidatus Brockarchaeota archaeon]